MPSAPSHALSQAFGRARGSDRTGGMRAPTSARGYRRSQAFGSAPRSRSDRHNSESHVSHPLSAEPARREQPDERTMPPRSDPSGTTPGSRCPYRVNARRWATAAAPLIVVFSEVGVAGAVVMAGSGRRQAFLGESRGVMDASRLNDGHPFGHADGLAAVPAANPGDRFPCRLVMVGKRSHSEPRWAHHDGERAQKGQPLPPWSKSR